MNDAHHAKDFAIGAVDDQVPAAAPAPVKMPAMFEATSKTWNVRELLESFFHLAFITFGLIDAPTAGRIKPDIAQVGKGPLGQNYSEWNRFFASAKASRGVRSLQPLASPSSINVRRLSTSP